MRAVIPSGHRNALVIIHEVADSLGPLAYGLIDQGFVVRYWNPQFHQAPPIEAQQLDLVIQLGGAANVGEQAHAEWMRREMVFVEGVIKQDVPIFSICLGAQLLANMFGARVYRMKQSEVGICQIEVDDQAGVFAPIHENGGQVFQSHSYAFDLPQGAQRLAFSDAVPCQAFGIGSNIVATQFHPDATLEVFASWQLEETDQSNAEVKHLIEQARPHAQGVQEASAKMFLAWLQAL